MSARAFRFEPLLNWAEQREEQQMLVLASVLMEEQQALDALEALVGERETELARMAAAGSVDPEQRLARALGVGSAPGRVVAGLAYTLSAASLATVAFQSAGQATSEATARANSTAEVPRLNGMKRTAPPTSKADHNSVKMRPARSTAASSSTPRSGAQKS